MGKKGLRKEDFRMIKGSKKEERKKEIQCVPQKSNRRTENFEKYKYTKPYKEVFDMEDTKISQDGSEKSNDGLRYAAMSSGERPVYIEGDGER